MRASRVVEAALRTAQHGHLITGLTSASSSMVMLLDEIHAAVDATSPQGAAATTNLLQNKCLTVRSCCQLVSTLKTLSLPLDPRIDRLAVILRQVQIVSSVAVVGPNVHAWAIGEGGVVVGGWAMRELKLGGGGGLGCWATALTRPDLCRG
jgi:hypothetical protein